MKTLLNPKPLFRPPYALIASLMLVATAPQTLRAWTFVNTGNCSVGFQYQVGDVQNFCCYGVIYPNSLVWAPGYPAHWYGFGLGPGEAGQLPGIDKPCNPDGPCAGFNLNCLCLYTVEVQLNIGGVVTNLSLSRFPANTIFYLDCNPNITGINSPDGDLPPDTDCNGMPVWAVSEPSVNLWVQDEPLVYKPALGAPVSLRLNHEQRDVTTGYNTNIFSLGKGWNCSWLSYVSTDLPRPIVNRTFSPNTGESVLSAAIYLPGGGARTVSGLSNSSQSTVTFEIDYLTRKGLTRDSSNVYTVTHPDGSKDVYGFVVRKNGAFLAAYLTERWDSAGHRTLLEYFDYDSANPVVRLKDVVDADGLTTQISYVQSNPYSTNLIHQVTDPFGRTVTLEYNNEGLLTNITDVASLSSSFLYDARGWITNMTTPYGTTRFQLTDASSPLGDPLSGRSVRILQPDGSCQLYLNLNSASGVPGSYPSEEIPDTAPYTNSLDVADLHLRNSFHWDARQYAALGARTNIADLTAGDFLLARMKHFLIDRMETANVGDMGVITNVGRTLSMEREASPDGSTPGQKTWYDYSGKTNTAYEGLQGSPLLIAQVLPDGTTRFTRTERNDYGLVTREVETYSGQSGVALRTNTFTYAANNIDLLRVTNAVGVQVVSNAYNDYHQVTTNYNALGEKTVKIYDGNHQLISVSTPTGLVTTNIYFTSGDASNRLERTIDYAVVGGSPVYYRTNAYTWSNSLIFTHTDPRGLAVTNAWDSLQRLRRVDYPDGTFVTNAYDKLDLVRVTDRMGFPTSYGYNEVRQRTAMTNANGIVTRYTYCSCGSLESVTNAFGTAIQQGTQYYYDNRGKLFQTVGPDGYSTAYGYDLLGQLVTVSDPWGTTTNWYNNQGLMVLSYNAFGRVSATVYDCLDRATNTVDANGVTVSTTFDALNRVLSRGYPDGGTESYGYTANVAGATSYTNQLGSNVVNYAFDPLGRKTAEAYPDVTTNQFAYGPADDLVTLTDGKAHTTTWVHDQHGRVTNKVDTLNNLMFYYAYDPNDRLTNRWTPAKGTTAFRFDAVGNLTNIIYPVSPAITLQHDALNRLTTMVDAVGTTTYGYTAAGQILSEDGPWADDTVSYTYNNRLRASVSVAAPNASAWTQTYGHDGAKRLTSTASPAGAFGYTYDPVRNLQVGLLTLPNGAYITNTFDEVSRLLSTVLKRSDHSTINSHSYQLNTASQRTRQTFTTSNYVDYAYDNMGQLRSAVGKEFGGTTDRLHEQLGYAYDPAGNLSVRTNNALVESFSVNELNELTTAGRTGTLTVAGTTTSPATNVTVNAQTAALYSDATFAKDGFTLVDGTNTFTAIARDGYGRVDTNASICYLPSSISFTYDLNGNLTSDGNRCFAYDDENQLISVWVTNAWRSDFVYDGKMRRRIRREYKWQSAIWNLQSEIRYVYDGNLVVQERDANNLPLVTYTRGNDLSGTLEGAGGIGGLLGITPHPRFAIGDLGANAYYHADGNGNITCLINNKQSTVARYLYDPFGNILSQSGPLADANLYRFSSKEFHAASGLVYYLYRLYHPNLQRWLNPDPVRDEGFQRAQKKGDGKEPSPGNLYIFVGNEALSHCDPLGLSEADIAKIVANYLQTAKEMCEKGIHCDCYGFGPLQDLKAAFTKSEGCASQSDRVEGAVISVKRKLDDDWKTEHRKYLEGPFWHQDVLVTENPQSGVGAFLILDPFRGCYSIFRPFTSSGKPSGDIFSGPVHFVEETHCFSCEALKNQK